MQLKDNPRFRALNDKGRNYLDLETGKTISRRQANKLNRSGLSNEELSRNNRARNLDAALSRPARGRKSLLKADEQEKQFILQARKEAEQRARELKAEEKARRELEREIAKQARKQVKRGRVTKQLLRPGSKGARVNFNDYNEYLLCLSEAKSIGVVHAYGLGMVGYDENTGENYGITVFTMRYISDPPIPEAVFDERFMEERLERQYFVFQHYFMHIAYKESFYTQVHQDWLSRGKPSRSKRKTRKGKRK